MALKRVFQLSGAAAQSPEASARELHALQAVSHPNVVHLNRTFPLVRIAGSNDYHLVVILLCPVPLQIVR